MSKQIIVDGEELIIKFNDEVSAFNGLKKAVIKNKGSINNHISVFLFEYLHKQGIPTHFIKKINDRSHRVAKVEMIPIEIIIRNKAAGPWMESLGFIDGEELDGEVVEYCYKSNKLQDPIINTTHILAMKLCSEEEIEMIAQLSREVNILIKEYFYSKSMELVDIKLEFGRNKEGNIVLADSITPDTLRIRDIKNGESLDKDVFRKDLGDLGLAYQTVLHRLEEK